METRRVFLTTLAAGAVPAAFAAPALLQAQSPVRDRVLQQVGREAARIYNAGKAIGLRGEHFRAAAANVRVLASLDLDAEVRANLQQHLRMHGRTGLLEHELDRDAIQRELRRFGMNVPATEIRAGTRPWTAREKALTTISAPGYSFAATLRRMAARLERAGARFAANGGAPDIRRVQYSDCDQYEDEIIVLEFAASLLCLSGNVWGCAAALASIALIEWAMYETGC